jgi:hypothetical protein
MSIRDKIKGTLVKYPVDVPEWGVKVFVRALTAGELRDQQKLVAEGADDLAVAIGAVCLAALEEDGAQLFADPDDLLEVPFGGITRLAQAIIDKTIGGDPGK